MIGADTSPVRRSGTAERALLACAMSVLLLVILRTAWVSDQAYLTFRTAEHLLAGAGPRWNIDERVQVAAHPLWLAVVTIGRAVTGDVYFSALALGALTSLLAAGLLLYRARAMSVAALSATMLISSKAFIEYSTSGLENPLSNLLLVLVLPFVVRERSSVREAGAFSLITGLAILAHPANGVLLAPSLIRAVRSAGVARSLRIVLVMMLPLFAWLIFAQVYYGTVLPGPWVAWLFSGRSLSECATQGGSYLLNSLANDPVTLLVIVLAMVMAVLTRQPGGRAAGAGMIAFLVAVVLVGGDSMSGRMMTSPFVLAVALLSRQAPLAPSWAWPAPFILVVGLGQLGSAYPLWSDSSFGPRAGEADLALGVTDARRVMFPETGLLRWTSYTALLDPLATRAAAAVAGGQRVVVGDTNVGTLAYYAGRDVHVIDRSGEADALLARLPVERPWRANALKRALPPGYVESIADGANHLSDPAQARLWDDVLRIARGPYGAPGRWRAMTRLLAESWHHLWSEYF
jgi:arabinofuranosyltransferase